MQENNLTPDHSSTPAAKCPKCDSPESMRYNWGDPFPVIDYACGSRRQGDGMTFTQVDKCKLTSAEQRIEELENENAELRIREIQPSHEELGALADHSELERKLAEAERKLAEVIDLSKEYSVENWRLRDKLATVTRQWNDESKASIRLAVELFAVRELSAEVTRERDEARRSVSFGKDPESFDWAVLGKIDEQETELAALRKKLADREEPCVIDEARWLEERNAGAESLAKMVLDGARGTQMSPGVVPDALEYVHALREKLSAAEESNADMDRILSHQLANGRGEDRHEIERLKEPCCHPPELLTVEFIEGPQPDCIVTQQQSEIEKLRAEIDELKIWKSRELITPEDLKELAEGGFAVRGALAKELLKLRRERDAIKSAVESFIRCTLFDPESVIVWSEL